MQRYHEYVETRPDNRPPLDVTALLEAWRGGDECAFERLVPVLLVDLRRLARSSMRGQAPGHTLQPTALVNEAYLRLVRRGAAGWGSRGQFLAYMATTMRRILINHARDRLVKKRGGGAAHLPLEEARDQPVADRLRDRANAQRPVDLLDLDRALETLSAMDARQARIVELRFFGGLTNVEIAEILGVSTRTVKRDWHTARLWLLRFLTTVNT